ncbi:hypothetical protein [Paucisalibacillus sp. EB02]
MSNCSSCVLDLYNDTGSVYN